MEITKDLYYVGVNDHKIDLFEGQYEVKNGMSYNSYLISDEKTCLLDTVDVNFKDLWLDNVKKALDGKKLDYLVVHHVEPDHSASIVDLVNEYPEVTLVTSAKGLQFISQFYEFNHKNVLLVKEKDILDLGKHKLTFFNAPFVHWPEVIVSYEEYTKTLFSADAFGKFGALDIEEDWESEARRYYYGIVGKYGPQVTSLLKKLDGVILNRICSLHGPILDSNLEYYLGKVSDWANYKIENNDIVICYTSVYGNTLKACLLLKEELEKLGEKVKLYDLARTDLSYPLAEAFSTNKVVLATTTYNNELFPFMSDFITRLKEHSFQNKLIGIIGNGTWADMVEKRIVSSFETLKDIRYCDTKVSLKSSVKDDTKEALKALANELHQK